MPPLRHYLAFFAVASVVLLVLILYSTPVPLRNPLRSHKDIAYKHPDFERYHQLRVLSPDEFPTDDPHRRVIIVGDIHGMEKPFERLLESVAYDHHSDVLVHTGDVLGRGPHKGSMGVIGYLTAHNVIGVRGNHDQKIIQWKGWLDWFATIPGGNDWLVKLHSEWRADHAKGYKVKAWIKEKRKNSREEEAWWWDHVPRKWLLFGDHFRIAQELTEEQYSYLVSLPLKLHIPSAHAFIIHAGLLPHDVRYDYDDHTRQPLARIPRIPVYKWPFNQKTIETLRSMQELSILRRVPQNTDPWVNLNIRSVTKKNKISRVSHKGTPWSNFWNDQMSMCNGFIHGGVQIQSDQQILSNISSQEQELPCYPASVIYGHAAARGLDIGRWTVGLDTGCAYGRRLSAMILGLNPLPNQEEWEEDGDDDNDGGYDEDEDEGEDEGENWDDWVGPDLDRDEDESFVSGQDAQSKKAKTIRFGKCSRAKIVRVPCH